MSTIRRLRIGLDLDDTLVPNTYLYHGPIWRCGLIIARALGHCSPYPPKVLELQQEIDAGMIPEMDFSVFRFPYSWVKTYRQLAGAAGQQPDPAVEQELLDTAMTFTRGPFRPFPGAVDVLATLRRAGHALFLITAGDRALQNYKIDEAGLRPYFDRRHVKITGRSKLAKMREVFGRQREGCLMVGDSLGSDIEAAQSLGVTTVWIPSQTWSYAGPTKPIKPDYTIVSIAELPPIIDCLIGAR